MELLTDVPIKQKASNRLVRQRFCNLREAFCNLLLRLRGIACSLALIALMGGCDWPKDIIKDWEHQCRSEARLIVHDEALWAQYLKEAEENYRVRAAQFPDTERMVVEYAPNFAEKYGPNLMDQPETVDGEVVRRDLYIVNAGKIVAQYVNFYARSDFPGRTVYACIGSFPELYNLGDLAR